MKKVVLTTVLFVFIIPLYATQMNTNRDGENSDSIKTEEDTWDVTAPFGPTSDLSFTTNEGTWMSCDVSPDGNEIIFDLLGNIYRIPIAGGEAEALTSGPAWDIQPNFSPDGKKIAFSSDRAGGDNIWIMNRDGSNPSQVTKEKFRLLNNPVFTPDGNYIIARKHFVKSRSLGAGEMWMYHISGGDGVQITKKRDWQHDAGEPDVSPDGHYLYFSQDISPGDQFEYNRNPYGSIYAIERIDLKTGERKRVISGPGGAVTPQISPDGKLLAFIRRVGLQTVLFVKDMETGNERALFHELNRDAQETWALFGVHPGYGWAPDNQSIFISAKGQFWKVDVHSGKNQLIPFNVKVDQKVTEAVRFPIKVGEPTFDIHVIRDLQVSPDNKKVVFHALGRLYLANRDGSNRKLLTSSKNVFEFQPVWTPDGKQIAFTTWNDEKSGTISVVSSKGGKPKELNVPPGHYFDPAWSLDGKFLIYRKGEGNWLRGFNHTVKPGIYILPVAGGSPRFVTDEGSKPKFSRDGKRILLHSNEGTDQALISVDLNGKDRQILATSTYIENWALSPDEQWIAFIERYHVYVASFPHTGQPVNFSSKMESLPITRLTRDSGFDVHWSADSKRIYWTLGAELFSRRLNEVFTFMDGAPDDPIEPDSVGFQLGWKEKEDIPSGTIALIGARIITMDKLSTLDKGTIIIENNRIKNIGPVSEVNVPLMAKKIDVSGKTIIPGLVDAHAHMSLNRDGLLCQQNWNYLVNLAFGVTTTHDPSNSTAMIFSNSEIQKAGKILAPRIFSTGTILYGAETGYTAEINSVEDAKSHLRRLKAFGAFTVKSYNQPRRDQRQQILKAARDLNMMVVPEGGSTFQHNINMILDGHTGIEHSIPVSPLYKDVITLFGFSQVGYTPTLIVSYGGLWGENYWYQHQKVFEHKRLLSFTPKELLDRAGRRRMMVEEDDYNYIENAKAAKALADAGVKVNNGGHGQLEGLGVHWEMWMLVQGGFTPLEALKASTLNGAAYIGIDGDLGSLAKGKLADLVILEKNPLENILNSDSVSGVMLNGRLYDTATMNERTSGKRQRKPFWWER